MERDEFLAHLRTLGLDEARQLALGATLTRETWMDPAASVRARDLLTLAALWLSAVRSKDPEA